MKNCIFTSIIFFFGLTVYSQETYLNTQFIKDKEVLEKEAYKDIKKRRFYQKQDSIRIAFVYCFKDIDSTGFEVKNNKYLDKIEPCYQYFNYILFPLFRGKFPAKKRLGHKGYALNKNDSIIAVRSTVYPYMFRPYTYLGTPDKEFEDLVKTVLTQEFDFCFYTSPNGFGSIWCIKDNKTFIYKIKTGEMKLLQECYAQDLDILSISDILGKNVDKSIEKYFIRFK
jgi:hypothetical protein